MKDALNRIVFDKREDMYELVRYEKDEEGFVHTPCPYGIKFSEKEHEENMRFALWNGTTPPSQVYMVGSVMCVRKCRYCKDGLSGTNAVLCSYKAETEQL